VRQIILKTTHQGQSEACSQVLAEEKVGAGEFWPKQGQWMGTQKVIRSKIVAQTFVCDTTA
jgi:hypothetical protein